MTPCIFCTISGVIIKSPVVCRRQYPRHSTTTGRAMLFSTIALSIGFFAYTQSSLNNLISFGLITGLIIIIIIIIIALLADLLLAPAMMALIYRNSDSHSK
jgi:predicted RND superfamily exporter protein